MLLLQLVHHSIFCVLFIIPVFLDDIFAARLAFILDTCVPHEFLLYAALLAHRLSKSNRLVKTTTYVALAWYTVTRLAQVGCGNFIPSPNCIPTLAGLDSPYKQAQKRRAHSQRLHANFVARPARQLHFQPSQKCWSSSVATTAVLT